MERILNIINLGAWVFLQFHVSLSVALNAENFLNSDISFDVLLLRIAQTLSLSDLLLIILGKSSGSLISTFFQLLGRLVVAWILLEPETNHLKFAAVVIVWSVADINRYLYYLFRSNSIVGMLRYNVFVVLYPVGGYVEMIAINDYIKRHAERLSTETINMIRVVQGCILLGIVILYVHMLKRRRQFYRKGQLKNGEEGTGNPRSPRSPRGKRD